MNTSEPLRDRLLAAPRDSQLKFLASAINELTVAARGFYDQPDGDEQMRRINEAIHRISGHLRDLMDPQEPMTMSRADGVVENAKVLHPGAIARILGHSPR
jgi:hypothetical protein